MTETKTILDPAEYELPAKVRTVVEILETAGNTVAVESTLTEHDLAGSWIFHWVTFESIESNVFLRTHGYASLRTSKPSGRTRFNGGEIHRFGASSLRFRTWSELRIRADVYTTTPREKS